MLKGFREFILRGNVVDLAVAVVVGVAFAALVTAFTRDILTPLIAAIAGKPNFARLTFTVNRSRFLYGDVIDAAITFLLVAAAVYFAVIVPVNALANRRKTQPPVDTTVKTCPECRSSIPVEATRCAFCTVALTA